MRPDRMSHAAARRFVCVTTELLGYNRTHRPVLFALRIVLNAAISATCVLWFLSTSHVLMGDIGNNAAAVRGVGFLSSPRGLKVAIFDRAVITNSLEVIEVSASPSGWDWDAMQQPFARKWTFAGVSLWYRTRQCLVMVAVRYSTLLCFFSGCVLFIHCSSKPRKRVPPAAASHE